MFEDYSARLRHRYPELQIEGGNFPPPTINNYIAKFLGVTKLLLIAMVVTGINPFTALNMDVPGVVTWAYENKVSVKGIHGCAAFLGQIFPDHHDGAILS